ncbi:MAG TPA: HAD family phosphatase [Terriglobales bacterium]|jgi:HAD superfamily hydrolase (TIGR01509 family)
MIRAIVFDMDGVIIDSHPVHRRAWRKFLATVGVSVSDDELDFILEGRRREEILRHFLGDLPFSIIEAYGRQKDQFFEERFTEIKLIPGVRELLKSLGDEGIGAAIATSASSSRTRETLSRLNLDGNFTAVVTGDDVTAGKPDPEVYLLASKRLCLGPNELLVIEDAPCGVLAATTAGMRCIGVSKNGRAEALRRCGAQFVIPDFVGLKIADLLQARNTIQGQLL